MVGQPGDAQLFGEALKGIVGKAVLLAQGREGGPPLQRSRAWKRLRRSPGRVGFHPAQAPLSFREHRIVELPTCFQVGAQAPGLACLDLEGQFEQKCGRVLFGVLALLGLLCAHQPHASLVVEHLFQS